MSYYKAIVIMCDEMQMNRLFETVYILLDKKSITARELAKHFEGGVGETIKHKSNVYAIGLYSDYHDDKYDVTVGNEVSESENPELTTKIIPASKYAKFIIQGHMQMAVAEAWGKIWSMDLDRSFTGDFEEYVNSDFENATIHIYIALN